MVNSAVAFTPADFADEDEIAGTGTAPVPRPAGPQQIGLAGAVGMGKTRAIVIKIKAVLAANQTARIAVFVPDHRLAAEMAGRLRDSLGASATVLVWQGTARPDPAAPASAPVTMCQRYADARAVREAGGDLADLCGSAKRKFCPFHPQAGGACGYIRQAQEAPAAQVMVFTHAMLRQPAPPSLRRALQGPNGRPERIAAVDFMAIDENFISSMLAEHDPRPVAWIDPATAPAVPDSPGDIAPGAADQHTRAVLTTLFGATTAAAPFARIDRAMLEAASLTVADCRRAAGHIMRCKAPLPSKALPGAGAGAGAVAQVLGSIAAHNARVLWLAKLCEVAADVLAQKLGSAALRVFDKGAGRTVKLRWRDPIHGDWLTAGQGIFYADATMNETIARVWLPQLRAIGAGAVAMPHVRVTQITDRAFGYTAVIEGNNLSTPGKEAAAKSARRVFRVIETLATKYAGKGAAPGPDVLVVLPKAIEADWTGKLPANVGTLHFGQLRGQDAFKGVAALLVVSRPLPAPEIVEDGAEIIFGVDVARLPARRFYEKKPGVRVMADGTGLTASVLRHPDPHAEAVRWLACEAELIQAVGRGRGIHRTALAPLDVIVLTDVPLDAVPVSKAVTLAEIWRDFTRNCPVGELERAGVLPMDWPGRGRVLAGLGFFKGTADAGEAFRNWLLRHPVERGHFAGLEATVTGGRGNANVARSSYIGSMGGTSDIRAFATPPAAAPVTPAKPAWTAFRYRRSNTRKAAQVWVRPDHADPRKAVETLMGETLDLFEPLRATPAKAPRRPRHVTMPAPALSIAPKDAIPLPRPAPTTSATPADEDGLVARLDAVPLGLPPVMNELVAAGALTPEDRRRHMNRFRLAHGPLAERERNALARLACELGPAAVTLAGQAAAARRLGLPFPAFVPRSQPALAA